MESLKVVIAEDDFRVADMHEKFLAKFSCIKVVGKALTAEQTFEFLQQKQPDLLLLDIYLPDHLGIDLLADIRERFPHVDIMMITAAAEKDFIETALHYGVEHYFIKPVTLQHFQATIEAYLEKRRRFQTAEAIDQEWVDSLFSTRGQEAAAKETQLPKGIDTITLGKVKAALLTDQGQSAEQIAGQIGASRTTARRYLEYLISVHTCKAEVEYGIVGRPERKYYLI
ncbi:response regulator [Heyndrickxia acidiproducens]|uniref:response regulator n=1 Tax=Heyndrickxia acidiproducens TaxID=1121084 RepID=UPI00037BB3DA|nr:response regulator [Heyndrickxia acidiproducens]